MATRKKSTRKATRKKARKKAPRKKASRKKAARKATRRRATKTTAARKKAPKKKAAARKKTDPAAIARKIIAATIDPSKLVIEELYAPDCVSVEGSGMRVEGWAGLREKNAGWEAGVESSTWNARNVLTGANSIAIEWDAQIKFKDGRSVQLNEMAIHELLGGKIVAERYFYDPTAIAPPTAAAEPAPSKPHYTPEAVSQPSDTDDGGIDPMDL